MARPQTFGMRDLTTAGLELVEHEGWSAVSFRSVAAYLDVSPMALYRLTPDAQDLRRVIADAAAEPIQPHSQADKLIDALHDWARAAYRHLGRYPGLPSYVISEWTELPRWLDIVETFLRRADSEGIEGSQAVAAVNAIYAYVLVRCQVRDTASAAPRRRLAPVQHERDRYPLIRHNIAEFTTAKTDKHFAIGLDLITNGLRDDISAQPANPSGTLGR
jgi:AcrR family transcriptional regulator